jgi:hypothetical protein
VLAAAKVTVLLETNTAPATDASLITSLTIVLLLVLVVWN